MKASELILKEITPCRKAIEEALNAFYEKTGVRLNLAVDWFDAVGYGDLTAHARLKIEGLQPPKSATPEGVPSSVVAALAQSISDGGQVAAAMERAYGLTRKGR